VLDQRGQLLRAALGFAQLTRYDDKGWRATFYTTGMEHSPTSATHRVGAHAVARDAAGGVGGAGPREPAPQTSRDPCSRGPGVSLIAGEQDG
jgi:hypothetical protein